MTYNFLSPSNDQWYECLAALTCDVYHEPAYVQAAAEHQGGEAVAFFAENDDGCLLVPLLRRQIPGHDRSDVTSPYGYPAPIWSARDSYAHWQTFSHALRETGIVSAFLRLHPLLPAPNPSCLQDFPDHCLVEHGPTVWLRRGLDAERRWEDTRPDHRSDIRRLQRKGYDVTRHTADEPDAFSTFRRMYEETMDRVGADPFYYFSDAYFRHWKADLSGHCEIAIVSDAAGDPAAAGLFTVSDRWMQFHLSGTAGEHRDLAPAKLMLHRMAQERHRSPNRDGPAILHLGGGLGADRDSLFRFKAGFSPERATFHSLRLVCDEAAYRDLAPGSRQESEEYGLRGFFPSYRRPD
jgi:hypothetical protein